MFSKVSLAAEAVAPRHSADRKQRSAIIVSTPSANVRTSKGKRRPLF
jgi:hypothetical protein